MAGVIFLGGMLLCHGDVALGSNSVLFGLFGFKNKGSCRKRFGFLTEGGFLIKICMFVKK